MTSWDSTLRALRKHAEALVAEHADPHEEGREMWGASMQGLTVDHPDYAGDLWLLWGALTDWSDKPDSEGAKAIDAMRSVAAEWLHLDAEGLPSDEVKRHLDYWLDKVLGDERR